MSSHAEQAAAVRRLVREQVAAVEHLEPAALKPTIEVLLHAREELRRDLSAWFKRIEDPTEKFTAYQMQVMLRSIEATLDRLGIDFKRYLEGRKAPATKLERAMLDGLQHGQRATGRLSIKMLEHEIMRLGQIFGQSLIPPQLDVASLLARGNKLLYKRMASSAARYGGKVAEDLRFQLSVGVARGETFEQLVQRLRRLGGPVGPIAVRGIFGTPGAIIEDIPEGLFARYRHFAERIVRTEMMHAYNVQHTEGIRELNAERSEGEAPYLLRWDSSADRRVCADCYKNDGVTAPIGGTFNGWGPPPLHPNCRCVLLAWRADWPALGDLPRDLKGTAERSAPGV